MKQFLTTSFKCSRNQPIAKTVTQQLSNGLEYFLAIYLLSSQIGFLCWCENGMILLVRELNIIMNQKS